MLDFMTLVQLVLLLYLVLANKIQDQKFKATMKILDDIEKTLKEK